MKPQIFFILRAAVEVNDGVVFVVVFLHSPRYPITCSPSADFIRPVCLPFNYRSEEFLNQRLAVVGYGRTDAGES